MVLQAREGSGSSRTVHISEKGMRLDRYLRIHAPALAPSLLSSLLKRGLLTVNGRRAAATDRLGSGDVVAWSDAGGRSGPERALRPAPQGEPLSEVDRAFLDGLTLWVDADLIAFDKPSGLAVHAGTGTRRDLDSMLARLAGTDGERPVLVHRLDKDTSGLLVAARRRAVAAALGRAFATRAVEKTYLAVVSGVPRSEAGVIDRPLRKVQTPQGGRMVAAGAGEPDPLAARTGWRLLSAAPGGGAALLAVEPETGRQHQIRVHLALAGHPILGDRLYGDAGAAPRLMLHAWRLRLRHPVDGTTLELEAPVPVGFDFARG